MDDSRQSLVDGPSIAEAALTYMPLGVDELERTFNELIWDLETSGLPHRGIGSDFWRGIRDRVVRKLLEEKTTVAATTSAAASEIVTWAEHAGVDLAEYRVPLSILVAIVVKSLLEQAGGGNPPGPGP